MLCSDVCLPLPAAMMRSAHTGSAEYLVLASYLEIYNEAVRDLFGMLSFSFGFISSGGVADRVCCRDFARCCLGSALACSLRMRASHCISPGSFQRWLALFCTVRCCSAGADHKTPLEVRESRDGFVVPFLTRQVRRCLLSSRLLSPALCPPVSYASLSPVHVPPR